jgi:GT2 family glycosyltransferase
MTLRTVVTVLPNWNLRADLAECLNSLAQTTYPQHHIIVVDNASTDDSVVYVREHYPCVTVLQLPSNRGYAAALNAGIACALAEGAEYVFALNNDTIVPPETLSRLVAVLEADSGIGIVTPKLLDHRRPGRLYSLGDRRSAWLPLPRAYGYNWVDKPEYGGLMEFDYVTGCAMLIPARLLRDAGLFDEGFFLFYEDSDFCHRVRERGYRIAVAGYAPIYHKVSVSTGGKNEANTLRIRARNRIRFYRRYRHGPAPALTMLTILLVAAWRTMIYVIRRPHLVRPYLAGLADGWREPPTSPQYPWPPGPCLADLVVASERVTDGA